MSLPVNVALVTIDLVELHLADTKPAPTDANNEICLVKDLGWTKLWLEFKVTTT